MFEYLITIDTDYASTEQLEDTICLLKTYSIPSIIFLTNSDKVIEKELKNKLFTFGIHPDFTKRSIQGRNIDKVISYCLSIVPEAKHVRTHDLIQDSHLLKKFCLDYGIKYDYSIFMPFVENLTPCKYIYGNKSLIRLPYFIEDSYLIHLNKERYFNLKNQSYRKKGMKIFNFHPIHIYLNSCEIRQVGLRQMNLKNRGTRDLFIDVLQLMEEKKS